MNRHTNYWAKLIGATMLLGAVAMAGGAITLSSGGSTVATSSTTGNFNFVDAGTAMVHTEVALVGSASVDIQSDVGFNFHDHNNSNNAWKLWDATTQTFGANTEQLIITRGSGTTPYIVLADPNDGKTKQRFGVQIGANTDLRDVPVMYPNDGGLQLPQACIADYATMSGGSVSVTFVPAFTGVPVCTCSEVNVAAPLACGPSSTPTISAVTLAISTGGSNRIGYICCGLR